MQTQVANLRAPEDHHPSIKTDPEALPLRLAPGMMRTYKAGQNRARPHRIFALSGKEVYLQSAAFVKIQRYFRGDLCCMLCIQNSELTAPEFRNQLCRSLLHSTPRRMQNSLSDPPARDVHPHLPDFSPAFPGQAVST